MHHIQVASGLKHARCSGRQAMSEPGEKPAIAICCERRRQLSEQFATAARLYAEAVVLLTLNHSRMSQNDYERLREAAEEARQHSEAMGIAFEEHVEWHQCVAQQNMRNA